MASALQNYFQSVIKTTSVTENEWNKTVMAEWKCC